MDTIFNYIGTIIDIEDLYYKTDAAIGDIYYCIGTNRNYIYTTDGWIQLEYSNLNESPKKMIYKSITNCTNCNGVLSWQSIYEPTVRCSYCGSILQKEVLT